MSDASYVLLAASLILGTCDPAPECQTDIVAEYAAPGGAVSAVVSHNICSNRPSSLEVALASRTPEGRHAHILLVLDSPNVDGVLRKPRVAVQWDTPTQATVRYDSSARMVFWGGSKVGDISVRYASLE